jgi:hypothetical protein
MVTQAGTCPSGMRLCATRSVDPAQHVTHDRPARLAFDGLLTENSVAVKRVDGASAALELDPCIDEVGPVLIAIGQRIRQWNLDDSWVPARPL